MGCASRYMLSLVVAASGCAANANVRPADGPTSTNVSAPRGPGFGGPVEAVFRQPLTLIAPSSSVAPRLASFVTHLKNKMFATIPLQFVTPTSAATFGPTAHIVFGSPKSNPLVAAIAKEAEWIVADDAIAIAGHVFRGRGLVLIAWWRHPDDPTLGIAVYTAGNDDDIVGMNNVFYVPTDWVVARRMGDGRFDEVASGNYRRE